MGTPRPLGPVKLFVGVLVSEETRLPPTEAALVEAFGPVDHRSRRLPFDATRYYAREMGNAIQRVLLSFEHLIAADSLASIKLRTCGIEQVLRNGASVPRPVNLDPGYLEQAKVVVASTKNFYHRMYLSDGVFAEVTLRFRNNTYECFPWTYPDYASAEYREFFLRTREIYRMQLRNRCHTRTVREGTGPVNR